MDDTIVSRDHIREKARRAFVGGKGRDEHGMNPGALAIKDWQDEWDRQYALWAKRPRQAERVAA
jgi:hypothetical protein